MFSKTFKMTHSAFTAVLMLILAVGLSACDGAKPPALMKAVKQFDSDATRDKHVKHMRKNHMDELLHKRDQTMFKGIRTEENSLMACINCHVPEKHDGEILRHTNPEHFCSTCHGYVAQQLDCFQCHVDHPVSDNSSAKVPNDDAHNLSLALNSSVVETASKDQENVAKTGESTGE